MRGLTRREFVQAAAAGAAVFHARPARSEVPPSERIRLGMVGYGKRGTGDLAEFLQNPEVECVVVCDVDDAHLAAAVGHVQQQRGGTPETVKDFRRIMDRNDLDAVLVATPDHWHALPTVFACQTGKDVYVEKPFARTIDEGRAMLEAAKANGRMVQMGSQWRSGGHFQEAVAYVQSGKLGRIRSVRAWAYNQWEDALLEAPEGDPPPGVDYDFWLGPAPQRRFHPNRFHRNFRWYWDYAGGLMTDWGVHLLNVCQWVMGPESPHRISSMGGRRVLGDRIETADTQTTIYEFPSYTLTWEHQLNGSLAPHRGSHGAWFCGEEGAVVIDAGGWAVAPEPGRSALEKVEHGPSADGRPAHVRNFLDSIKSRKEPVQHPEISHQATTLAHLGNLALRAGRDILWDGVAERITNDAAADALVGGQYREPWKLPHARRG